MGLTYRGVWYDGPQGSGLRSRLPGCRAAGRRHFRKPVGSRREKCALCLARAIRCANRAGANAPARARRIRAQKRVPPPWGRPGRRRRGRNGTERNATEERYAGTEPQNFGDGMGNMTFHDTMQGVFHEPPHPACAAACAQSRLALHPARPTVRFRAPLPSSPCPCEGGVRPWLPMPPRPAGGVHPESGSRMRGQSGARTAPAPTRAGAGRRYARKRGPRGGRMAGRTEQNGDRYADDTSKAGGDRARRSGA